MWLNQKTVDAIRIMAELALRWPDQVRALELPIKTDITFMNIQKTVHGLALAGLIETQRGRYGGMRLARSPDTISVSEIVRAFEPTDCPVHFLAQDRIERAISAVLFKAHRGFFQPLDELTLAELLNGSAPKDAAAHAI